MADAAPTTRDEFIDYCKRRLGYPVVNINITTEQAQDRIRDALVYWREYHYNATTRDYYDKVLTAEDISNKYLTLPDTIFEVMRIVPTTGSYGSALFSPVTYAKYQMMYGFFFGSATSFQIQHYTVAMKHLELLNEMLGQKLGFRFNRIDNKCYIDTQWGNFQVGDHVVLECLSEINAAEMYSDRWLAEYTTALFKKQWGANIGVKYKVQLLNGTSVEGAKIFDDACNEVEKLKTELMNYAPIPPGFIA